ncbi:hypothetical protein [Stieleria mannarensis]|uniref:hypothetical protein n=1 Tax=Stieleria mannarensis TaxID=2755585 RepID=UPI0016018421|nr:hypothetical protein [Rhodopirellula sp. JC639]
MARLDKQLDKLSGEKVFRLHWPEDDSMDMELLRAEMVREINSHDHRIPLDLRGVKGAPAELVDLLVDMERYARSKSKILSMTWMLPPMRDAIDERLGRRSRPKSENEPDAASKTARDLLNHAEKKNEYDLSKAQKLERKKPVKKSKTGKKHYLKLVAIALLGAIAVGVVEGVIIMQQEETLIVPEKGFESHPQ